MNSPGFRFKNADGAEHSVQIDFAYVESHAGLVQQAYVSRVMEAHQGADRSHRHEYVSVP